MMNTKPFYEKNRIIDDPVNITFEELLDLTEQEFADWIRKLRAAIKYYWDTDGTPCRMGSTEQEMIESWNKLSSKHVGKFTLDDELTPDQPDSVIKNTTHCGAEVDQFFSNMMRVPLKYSENPDAPCYSIYDMFDPANEHFQNRMVKGEWRHLRKDSFYFFSSTVKKNSKDFPFPRVESALEWITLANEDKIGMKDFEYWIQEVETSNEVSTGYVQVKQSDFWQLTWDELQACITEGLIPSRALANIKNSITTKPSTPSHYVIRLYKLGQRMIPHFFKCARIGYVSVATNFPNQTYRLLVEKFTNHILPTKDQIIVYDPSMGWAGRLLGCLSIPDRNIHYVGTDPNMDNFHTDGVSKYQHIVNAWNKWTYRGQDPFGITPPNTTHFFHIGSEEIRNHPDFQQYKGKVDFIGTSPPYFNREFYSKDPGQSCVKFGSSYESWRDGFLRPTLETCVEWLKPDRYMIWNIADILVAKGYLPLEKDSCDILVSLGMVQLPPMKMVMASMPGAQRLDSETGLPKCKNYVKVDGEYLKCEPLLLFYKPPTWYSPNGYNATPSDFD